jgi:hypothetical protein
MFKNSSSSSLLPFFLGAFETAFLEGVDALLAAFVGFAAFLDGVVVFLVAIQ